MSQHSDCHYWLARSSSLAIDPHEARQQALEAAADQLATRVHVQVNQMTRGRGPTEDAIRGDLLVALNDHDFVVDEFSQSLATHRGGAVWRHALLVEFTPNDVANAALAAVHQDRRMQQRQLSSVAAFVGLLVLTGMVYAFLNVATKGYYREALLCGTVVIVILGGAVLLMVA
jgi:hypothetical protein